MSALGTIEGLRPGYYQTIWLVHLGDAYQAAGEPVQARHTWQQVLDILEELKHSDADQVRARLRGEVSPPATA